VHSRPSSFKGSRLRRPRGQGEEKKPGLVWTTTPWNTDSKNVGAARQNPSLGHILRARQTCATRSTTAPKGAGPSTAGARSITRQRTRGGEGRIPGSGKRQEGLPRPAVGRGLRTIGANVQGKGKEGPPGVLVRASKAPTWFGGPNGTGPSTECLAAQNSTVRTPKHKASTEGRAIARKVGTAGPARPRRPSAS